MKKIINFILLSFFVLYGCQNLGKNNGQGGAYFSGFGENNNEYEQISENWIYDIYDTKANEGAQEGMNKTIDVYCNDCLLADSCVGEACQTQACIPDCNGKECGEDSCGGECGICATDHLCLNGVCVEVAKKFGESCETAACDENLLCLDWTNEGGGITCAKFCETDADCSNSCCGLYFVENEKICTDPYLAITKNTCYKADYGESCANGVVCKNGLNCFDWTPSGGAITCGKHCQNDSECQPTCCGPYNVEGKKTCTPLEMSSICPVLCTPNCAGKECGKDGCGGQCGNCGIYGCLNGKCVTEFIDLNDGTIKTPNTTGDWGTNLIWQKNPSDKNYGNIVEAANYCDMLNLAGAGDWHLPSYAELAGLLLNEPQGKCYIHPIFQVPDPALPDCALCSPACDWFWTATHDNNCPNPPEFPLAAMIAINFSVGYSAVNCCGSCYSDRVRCVRYENVKPLE